MWPAYTLPKGKSIDEVTGADFMWGIPWDDLLEFKEYIDSRSGYKIIKDDLIESSKKPILF